VCLEGARLALGSLRPSLLRFGAFELDLRTGELRKSGVLIKLSPQPFKVLAILADRAGEVVTREELQQQIWGEGTFVDFEQGLNYCIKQIRVALVDDAEAPHYLATIPRRGYRFLAPVERRDAPGRRFRVRKPVMFSSAVVLLLAAISFAAFLHIRTKPGPTSRVAPPIKSLVVLPLENLSGDPAQDYFSEGMSDALTTDLAQIEALRVVSRTSAIHYAGSKKTLPEIARELHVDAVVEGAVTRSGNRVRISAQLIYAPTDTHLWANSYEGNVNDVLALQGEVARAIANQIAIKLTPSEQQRFASAGTVNIEAYDEYLKGRFGWNRRTVKGIASSVTHFERAIAMDPHYALAYAGLADSYIILGNFGLLAPREAYPKAEATAAKAVELDGNLSPARTSLAFATYLYDWDWTSAEQGFKQAIALDPNYGPAHQWYGVSLVSRGLSNKATAELKRAQEVEPDSMIISAVAAWVDFLAGRYDEGIEQARKTLELDPDFAIAHDYLGLNYEQKGEFIQAVAEFHKDLRDPTEPFTLGALGDAYAASGHRAEAEKVLQQMKERNRSGYFPPFYIALVYAGLGDKDNAFRWLDKAYNERFPWLIHLKVDPRLSNLRSDPRFADLARRVGLP
jgi:TolB-like protein/DNA-binding winged helix-turn-helix (wHTH) protein/Flp pilus assembly protein TadD